MSVQPNAFAFKFHPKSVTKAGDTDSSTKFPCQVCSTGLNEAIVIFSDCDLVKEVSNSDRHSYRPMQHRKNSDYASTSCKNFFRALCKNELFTCISSLKTNQPVSFCFCPFPVKQCSNSVHGYNPCDLDKV